MNKMKILCALLLIVTVSACSSGGGGGSSKAKSNDPDTPSADSTPSGGGGGGDSTPSGGGGGGDSTPSGGGGGGDSTPSGDGGGGDGGGGGDSTPSGGGGGGDSTPSDGGGVPVVTSTLPTILSEAPGATGDALNVDTLAALEAAFVEVDRRIALDPSEDDALTALDTAPNSGLAILNGYLRVAGRNDDMIIVGNLFIRAAFNSGDPIIYSEAKRFREFDISGGTPVLLTGVEYLNPANFGNALNGGGTIDGTIITTRLVTGSGRTLESDDGSYSVSVDASLTGQLYEDGDTLLIDGTVSHTGTANEFSSGEFVASDDDHTTSSVGGGGDSTPDPDDSTPSDDDDDGSEDFVVPVSTFPLPDVLSETPILSLSTTVVGGTFRAIEAAFVEIEDAIALDPSMDGSLPALTTAPTGGTATLNGYLTVLGRGENDRIAANLAITANFGNSRVTATAENLREFRVNEGPSRALTGFNRLAPGTESLSTPGHAPGSITGTTITTRLAGRISDAFGGNQVDVDSTLTGQLYNDDEGRLVVQGEVSHTDSTNTERVFRSGDFAAAGEFVPSE